MLDETEKEGVFKILELLLFENLISLTDTVTGKVVTVESKEEALNAIMVYTRNGEELLKRRKVRREHLYQYLAQEGHVEHPAADKTTLLKKILQLWESRRQNYEGDLEDGKQPDKQLAKQPDNQMAKQPDNQMAKQPEGHMAKQPEGHMAIHNEERLEVNSNESTNSSQVKHNPNLTAQPTNEGQLLAVHFSAWFYQLLETLSKASYENEGLDWGPQHFWQDAKLTIQCNEPSGTQETTVEGAQSVSEKFLTMVVADQLCFNPHLTNDSVQGKQDPHGLTLVMVCGTVHKQKQFIGVFEQSFGLIRDPTAENNWKIKFSKLMLKASECGSNNQIEGASNNQIEGGDT